MIIYMEIKVSKIKTVKSYMTTLREFNVGDTKYYKTFHTDYNGYHNARMRLENQNAWNFTLGWCKDKKHFMITRNK